MSKIISKTTILVMLAIFTLSAAQAFAQQTSEYTVLAPLPGTTEARCEPGFPDDPACKTTLQTYLPGVFNLAIGLSAVFAVLMIVIGGFQYISSDAIMKKEEGKKRIQNAVLGLVLVISAWLILYTINPNLLTLNLNIEPATISPSAGGGTLTDGGPSAGSADILTGAALQQDAANRSALTGVRVNNEACTTAGVACTNLNGLPAQMITALNSFNLQCDGLLTDCPVIITGGTETYAHASHGPGRSIVDIRPSPEINNYLGIPNPQSGQHSERETTGGWLQFTYENTGDNGRSTAPHWHVVFTQNRPTP